jgi:SAM-dependent methyltransferase
MTTIVGMATSFDYRRQAETYDRTRAASPSVLAVLRQALGEPDARPLLDVGGGTGNYARALADEGWPVVVVDRSPHMLAVAAGKGLPVARGDASELPVADGSAGAVVLISMLHHVPDWERAIAEARRAVAPGGVVVFMGFALEHVEVQWFMDYLPTAAAHFGASQQPLDDLRRCLPGAEEHLILYDDLVDGSMAALCRQPELLLDPDVRRQTSFFEWAEANTLDELERAVRRLEAELAMGLSPQDEVAARRAEIGDAIVLAWRRPG